MGLDLFDAPLQGLAVATSVDDGRGILLKTPSIHLKTDEGGRLHQQNSSNIGRHVI
jgi:hypothetical protein